MPLFYNSSNNSEMASKEKRNFMKVCLTHHANALSAEEDPERQLSEVGVSEAERLGKFMKGIDAIPSQIIHSDKQWTRETGERVAASLGQPIPVAVSNYGIAPKDPVEPFIDHVESEGGDIMMTGHGDFLLRASAKLLTGDERRWVLEFSPGNGTTFCLEKNKGAWKVVWGWRQEQLFSF